MNLNILAILITFLSCTNRDTVIDKNTLLMGDYRLFQNTPAWNLAKAVEDGDVSIIRKEIGRNKGLLNFREARFGQSILKLAVENRNFISTKTLVELGADPNMQDSYEGTSALMEAANDGGGEPDIRFLEILIRYGGDVNRPQQGPRIHGNAIRSTPLQIACLAGAYEYVKMLVNAGADVNYVNEYGSTNLYAAIVSRHPEIVMYLLEKGANFRLPMYKTVNGHYGYILNAINNIWRFPGNSEDSKKESEIKAFLRGHGVN